MTDYFSDRQFGSNPRIEEKIDQVAWDWNLVADPNPN